MRSSGSFAEGRGRDQAARWIASAREVLPGVACTVIGSGLPVLLIHGFPTWSFDWREVAGLVSARRTVIAPDLIGYGASRKPSRAASVPEQADMLERLMRALGHTEVEVVAHDYGTIIAQELADRADAGRLGFGIGRMVLLNGALVYSAYRPTAAQKLLMRPIIGPIAAAAITAGTVRKGLDGVLGPGRTLSDDEFGGLWHGIRRRRGHKRFHRLLRYNAEREIHAHRWEAALERSRFPLRLVWGLADPVSGAQVLELARARLPRAEVTSLPHVGHYPQLEAPAAVASAILGDID